MRAAVCPRNLANPAYAAVRLGAERAAAPLGAQALHVVSRKPDDPVARKQAEMRKRRAVIEVWYVQLE